jgi:hypothetical protein
MTDKVNTLLNQLREPNRIYQGLADQETARKLADLLEEAVSGKAPHGALLFLDYEASPAR